MCIYNNYSESCTLLLFLLLLGGDVYGWGTNSMGQCGQGHNNTSISKPGKVEGLDGVQVQQISAGTSHSIVWTAIPNDRYMYMYITTNNNDYNI